MTDAAAYRSSLPRKRMGAGALVRNDRGQVLLVEPTYKTTWELPGGAVDADESPRQAVEREVQEELGLQLELGRLLCIEWQGPEPDRTESLMFIYDGGVLPESAAIRLPAEELASYRFVDRGQIAELMVERLSRRTLAALQALDEARVVEVEHGVHVPAAEATWGGTA